MAVDKPYLQGQARPTKGRDVGGKEGVSMSGMQRLRKMTPRVFDLR